MRNLRRSRLSMVIAVPLALLSGPTLVLAGACGETKPSANQAPTPTQTAISSSSSPGSTASPTASSQTAAAPSLFPKCKDAPTEAPDELPDAGVVMKNAEPVGDAGTSDRLKPVEKVIADNVGKFRCCYHEGGPHPPGETVKVTMVLELKQTGVVRGVTFDRAETDTTSDAIEQCIADVAKSLTYMESGVDKDTKVRHRFKFNTHANR